MEIFPTSAGTRPRLACELRPGGAVAARAEDASGVLTGIGGAEFAAGALVPGLKAGNLVDRGAVAAAIRRALESAGGNVRGSSQVTLVVPDAAVRVILLDFDTLPSKAAEAMPVVRFRLKKLLPFEADEAAVSYQVMSSERGLVRVLAVAMPNDVLAEYEAVVREAGFEPGAVLPSTLAALAGLDGSESAALVVNASPSGVTTAIVQGGVLLLHRSVDLQATASDLEADTRLEESGAFAAMNHAPSKEQLMEDPVGYGDPIAAAAVMQAEVETLEMGRIEAREDAATGLQHEVMQAVSVGAAYFEDSLGFAPETLLAAGVTGAESLAAMLAGTGLQVREMVEADALAAGAARASVRRGLLAGVRGALRG